MGDLEESVPVVEFLQSQNLLRQVHCEKAVEEAQRCDTTWGGLEWPGTARQLERFKESKELLTGLCQCC